MIPYVQMKGITKIYPENNVLANNKINFKVQKREIHALVGENGAGKTTLMKILYGLEQPEEGKIYVKGQEVKIHSPLDAHRLGIGMVHQHFKLISEFTIAQNVVLGLEPLKRIIIFDDQKAIQEVEKINREYGFDIDPRLKVSKLSVGQMQVVEIIKILYWKADLLILDEPTSLLTEQQIKKLFAVLRRLVSMGKTIIIITHKINEVKEISDRVTVLRKGKLVAVRRTSEVTKKELSQLMVGKSVILDFVQESSKKGEAVVEFKEVTLKQKGGEHPLLDSINFSVHSGEIVGVAAIAGNGGAELEDIASGLCKVTKGTIFHYGEDVSKLSVLELRKRGLAYVPADRLHRGSSLQAKVSENVIISNHHSFLKNGFFNQGEVRNFTNHLIRHYSVEGEPEMPMGTLSGGNIQKVILARELTSEANFIIFSEPTWGLDVASSEFVYNKIFELRKQGKAILLISSNLDEVLALADTIIVLYKGKIVGLFANSEKITKEIIGEYMLGIKDDFLTCPQKEEEVESEH